MKTISQKGLLLAIVGLAMILFVNSCGQKSNEAVKPTMGDVTVTNVTYTSATVTIILTSNGGSPLTSFGISFNGSHYPANSTAQTSYTHTFTNLNPGTEYTTGGYATNTVGNSEVAITFKTSSLPVAFIKEGKEYHYMVAGTQTWTIENYAAVTNNDGSQLENNTNNPNSITPGWCDYENDPKNGMIYGHLYNSAVALSNKIAPDGWHIPSMAELSTLNVWVARNGGWSNNGTISFFTTLANGLGGYMDTDGKFKNKGVSGNFFTATTYGNDYIWCCIFNDHLSDGSGFLIGAAEKNCWNSIRFVKNQ